MTVGVRTDVQLHAEVPLLAFLGLVHLPVRAKAPPSPSHQAAALCACAEYSAPAPGRVDSSCRTPDSPCQFPLKREL